MWAMPTLKKTSDSSILVRMGLVSIPLLFVLINLTSLMFIDPLSRVMIEDSVLNTIDSVTAVPMVRFFSQIFPVLLIILMLFFYCLPLFRNFWNGRPEKSPDAAVVRRLLGAATIVAVFTGIGWVYSIPVVVVAGKIMGVPMSAAFYLEYSSHSLVLFGFAFILSFYSIETLVQRIILPRVLQANEAVTARKSFSPSITARLMILAMATFVLPSLIFFNTLRILNNQGDNALGRDLLPILGMAFPVLFLLVTVITALKIISIVSPIGDLTSAAERVEQGNLQTGVTVGSMDRIGMLGAAFNNMITGLEERDRMSSIFGKVVDPRIRDHLMDLDITPQGEIRDATVIFFDLAGFTALSESLPPRKVVQFLNLYFEAVSLSVEKQGGLINKFIGDGVLAVFGVPAPLEDHEEKALMAVENLHRLMKGLNRKLQEKKAPPLRFRAGVHSGEVLSGLIGSNNRKEYTIIGDAVNVASRIEPLGKEFNTSVILSKATADRMKKKRALRYLGPLPLRGKKEPMDLYSLTLE